LDWDIVECFEHGLFRNLGGHTGSRGGCAARRPGRDVTLGRGGLLSGDSRPDRARRALGSDPKRRLCAAWSWACPPRHRCPPAGRRTRAAPAWSVARCLVGRLLALRALRGRGLVDRRRPASRTRRSRRLRGVLGSGEVRASRGRNVLGANAASASAAKLGQLSRVDETRPPTLPRSRAG